MVSIDPLPDITIGYPKLAARIEIQPELSIYRRFGALNAQNLLYFQAQLVDLEAKLRAQQAIDNTSTHGHKSKYAVTWLRLENSAIDGDTKQRDLVIEIRALLREFSEFVDRDHALIQQSIIMKLPEAEKCDIHYMQNYLHSKEMGGLALLGRDATSWGSMDDRNSHKPDLVALKPRTDRDAFSSWAARKAVGRLFTYFFAHFVKPSPVHGLVGIEDTIVYRATYGITSIVASMIPIISIVVLYYINSMSARLATIAAFNILVSLSLMILAGAKRAEIFAVTAAFAAVQVVFIGTDKSSARSL